MMNAMVDEIERFIDYLKKEKQASSNTQISYQRDLLQLSTFLEEKGITEVHKVTRAVLNSYIEYLEKQGKAASTISRVSASIKAFFHYAYQMELICRNPAELIRTPRVEKRTPMILTMNEITSLLTQPNGQNPKEIRDKAMLELLSATGIRVSELIHLEMEDVNLAVGMITCKDANKIRIVPFGKDAKKALMAYLEQSRPVLLKQKESSWLFTNCNGKPMSRQGFWKIIKYYGEKAGIKKDITPHALRHAFAAHLISQGADIHAVQTMLGHSEVTTTQMYLQLAGRRG